MKKSVKLVFACFSIVFLLTFAACKKESNSKPDYGTGLKFDKKRYDKVPEKAQLLKRSYENLPSKVVLTDLLHRLQTRDALELVLPGLRPMRV